MLLIDVGIRASLYSACMGTSVVQKRACSTCNMKCDPSSHAVTITLHHGPVQQT